MRSAGSPSRPRRRSRAASDSAPEADLEYLDFDEAYVHNVGRNQEEFIRAYGERVISSGAGRSSRPRSGYNTWIMDWREHIHSDPEILSGKPVVKGTRLSVDFLLGLFAMGWTEEQVLQNYPTLDAEAVRAVFAFAAESARDEPAFELRR